MGCVALPTYPPNLPLLTGTDMRQVRISWLALSLFFLIMGCTRTLETPPESSAGPKQLQVGDPAPDFTLLRLDGGTVSVAQLAGKPIVLYFGSSGCPYFRGSLPRIKQTHELYEKFAQTVVVYTREAHPVFAFRGTEREMQEHREKTARDLATEFGLTELVAVDGSDNRISQTYNTMPVRLYVIDSKGIIAYVSEPGPQGYHVSAVGPVLDKMLNIELAGTFGVMPQMAADTEDDN
jgi:peroxiredoxin